MGTVTIIAGVAALFFGIMCSTCLVAYFRSARAARREAARIQQRASQRRKSSDSIALAVAIATHQRIQDGQDGSAAIAPRGEESAADIALEEHDGRRSTIELEQTVVSKLSMIAEDDGGNDDDNQRATTKKKGKKRKKALSARTKRGRAERAKSKRARRRTLQQQELPSFDAIAALAAGGSPKKKKRGKKGGLTRKAKSCSVLPSSPTARRLSQRRNSLEARMAMFKQRAREAAKRNQATPEASVGSRDEVRRRAKAKLKRALLKIRATSAFRHPAARPAEGGDEERPRVSTRRRTSNRSPRRSLPATQSASSLASTATDATDAAKGLIEGIFGKRRTTASAFDLDELAKMRRQHEEGRPPEETGRRRRRRLQGNDNAASDDFDADLRSSFRSEVTSTNDARELLEGMFGAGRYCAGGGSIP